MSDPGPKSKHQPVFSGEVDAVVGVSQGLAGSMAGTTQPPPASGMAARPSVVIKLCLLRGHPMSSLSSVYLSSIDQTTETTF